MSEEFRKVRYGEQHWTHKSVHALMEGRSHTDAPGDVIRAAVRALIDEARQFGWRGPPFDPVALAELQGIRVTVGQAGMSQDAMIRSLPDGSLEIVWSPDATPARRNFSLCHEIGHTLFPDCFELVRHRRDRPVLDPDRELEGLCDLAASEMLMPSPEFPRDLSEAGFCAAGVNSLAKRYAASQEAAARRAVLLQAVPCHAVFVSERHKPADRVESEQGSFDFYEAPPRKLRVDYAVGSTLSRRILIPQHKSAPENSCAYVALKSGSPAIGGHETWTVAGGTELLVHAEALPLSPTPEGTARVLALLTPL